MLIDYILINLVIDVCLYNNNNIIIIIKNIFQNTILKTFYKYDISLF